MRIRRTQLRRLWYGKTNIKMFTQRKKEADEICKYFSVDVFFHPLCTAGENIRNNCQMHSIEKGTGYDPVSNEMKEVVFHRCEKLRSLCDKTGHLPRDIAYRYCEQFETDKLAAVTYDFVRDETRIHTKVGRNAPCPCGSGKKYKKCCGR